MLQVIRQGPSHGELSGRGVHPLAGRAILQIIPELSAGGAERAAIDIAAALAEVGAKPLVASEGGRMTGELRTKGGIWLPFPAGTKNPLAMASNRRRLAELIDSESVALVHARSRAPAWVAYGVTRRKKIPFVTTYHGAYSTKGPFKLFYNSIMAKGDAVIANSSYTARRIAELYPFARDNIRLIERGIDLRVFNPQEVDPSRVKSLRQAWNVALEDRIVLLPGRLTSWKGHKILIEAARLLVASGLTGTKFVLAGEDQSHASYVNQVDAAIAQAGLGATVLRTGHCGDIPAALLAATAVVVPSTRPEAFGRGAIEAQAMGTPVIVSNLGGLAELVSEPSDTDRNLRTGWRVPAGDANALAAAISEVLKLGATAREAFALRARAAILRRFSVERMKAETLATYSALLRPRS
jgi:glycosyltransferase involved in cell wall biosynthesis